MFCDNSKSYTYRHLNGQEQFYYLVFLKNPAAPMSGIFTSLRQATVLLQAGRGMRSLLQFKSLIDHIQSKIMSKMNYPAAELRGIKMNFYLINPDAEHRGILLIKF